tara:strand:- start:128 stop:448 length:321 start_codon:yes stop_codon:yes gene_type:complete
MNNLANKIIIYLGRTPNFETEIMLQNDTGTDYIKTWNASDKVKPTDDQLNALSSEATKLENNEIAVANRKKEYPSIEELVVALYDTEDKLALENKRAAVKLKYPKE